jgi:hypothetical protein
MSRDRASSRKTADFARGFLIVVTGAAAGAPFFRIRAGNLRRFRSGRIRSCKNAAEVKNGQPRAVATAFDLTGGRWRVPRARGFPFVVTGAAAGAPSCGRKLATFVVFGRVVVETGENAAEAKNGEHVAVATFDLFGGRL